MDTEGWYDLKKETPKGPPNGEVLAWWVSKDHWNRGKHIVSLDTILFDENGVMDGKGGCGSDFCSHVRPVRPDELPRLPASLRRKSKSCAS